MSISQNVIAPAMRDQSVVERPLHMTPTSHHRVVPCAPIGGR
jgi:hypothetical protein